MTPELLLALVSGRSIALSEPVGGRRPEWTLVEAGWGMARLSTCYELAFRYRHSRDGGVYPRLWSALRFAAERLAWCDRWKRRIEGRLYVDDLVGLVLAEEWMSHNDRQRLLTRCENSWPEGVYERQILPKQRRIGMVLDRWCSAAHEHVARRIRVDEEDEFDNESALA